MRPKLPPNKRLKLTGADRSNGSAVLCPGGHELSFNDTARRWASRPRFKRHPLDSYLHMDSRRITTVLALSTALLSTLGRAQDLTIIIGTPPAGGARGFGGSGATPISPTTVIQFLLEPRDSGGAQLAYAIAIKGEAGWYNERTTWNASDSVPGYETTNWNVGPVRYAVSYSQRERHLRTFGKEIDLAHGNLVLVTLGSQGAADATVSADRHVTFVMFEPGGFLGHFLPKLPELASFAGLQPAKQ